MLQPSHRERENFLKTLGKSRFQKCLWGGEKCLRRGYGICQFSPSSICAQRTHRILLAVVEFSGCGGGKKMPLLFGTAHRPRIASLHVREYKIRDARVTPVRVPYPPLRRLDTFFCCFPHGGFIFTEPLPLPPPLVYLSVCAWSPSPSCSCVRAALRCGWLIDLQT